MVKIGLLVAAGLAAGFMVSLRPEPAHACSCIGFRPWQLTLVNATPEVDRTSWAFDDTFLNRNSERDYTLHSGDRYVLDLEVK